MLSTENPPRDPPSCPSQISQLKTSSTSASNSDEKKASSDKQLQLVDLLKSDLDDNHHRLPKFSIRDYVFNTRNKDIKNNWPFSQENLELCLKHGVTVLLPPFQSPDTLRNPSLESCSSDNSILREKESTKNSNGEPSGQSDHTVFVDSENVGCNTKIAVGCLSTNPSGSEGDKEFPSTITSQSCSEIDSHPTTKSPSLESKTDILPELSVAKTEPVSPASNKTENITQAPAKNCRLIVRLRNLANQSTKEDTAVNNFMYSEAMASKICPVCKTFSSSSNTTLNAHIDQCLSVESTTKWSTNSKVIKHRIKPRKVKSMVEIYATAPHCTLEELDRRNGTKWATNSTLPAQETEICADQNKQGSSPVDLEETPNEGAVYIDANGTKLRILSKSNDPSLFSEVVDGPRPNKFMNRDKLSRILLAKKKKKQNQVHKQTLKHGKKICISRPHHASEINDNHYRNSSGEENHEKEECMSQQFKAQTEVKFSRPDMIRGWVCSKRSGLTKKSIGRDDPQHSGNGDYRDLQVGNDQLSLGNSKVKKRCVRRTPNIFENLLSSPGSSKRIDNSSRFPHDEVRRQPSLWKKVGLSSAESQASYDRKRSQVFPRFPDHNIKRSRNDEAPNREDHVSFPCKGKAKMNEGLDRNADHPVIDPKLSAGHHTLLSKARRFSSLRKKLSAGRASVPDSKLSMLRKSSAFKKSRVHCISESNEEAVSGVDRQHLKENPHEDQGRMQRTCDIESVNRTGVLKIRKNGGDIMISGMEEAVALKTSQSVSMSYHHDAGDHEGSFMLGSVSSSRSDVVESSGRNIHTREKDFNIEPPSEVAVGGAFMDFRNSLDAEFHGLAGSSDARFDSRFIEVYKEPHIFEAGAPRTSAESILSGGQEMFSAAEVPENMIMANGHMMAELDSSEGHGNYFVEVDPIPIPGPPGSFLPSPGHMSEDLQGNSSLTSSRVQSSDDHQELVDHSSDSPISATSTISNSTLARSDSKSSGKMLVRCHPVLDEIRSDFIAAAKDDPIVENTSPVLKATNAGVERRSLDELKVNSTISEKATLRFKSDEPCCCSGKEGFSQNVSLNFQESQLLRRRTMAAVVVPVSGKEMSGDIDRRLNSLRSELSSISGQSPRSKTATRSPMGNVPSRISSDSEVKFPSSDDCESTSPPASNPVLRLMGKNLMVVNKEENVSPQCKPSQLSSMIGHANPQVVPVSGVSVGNAQNENQHVAYHVVSRGPFCFNQTERCKPAMQQSEIRWTDGFGNGNPGTPQMSPPASPAMLSSRGAVRSFMGSLMHYEYIDGYSLPTEQRQPLNRLGASVTCDIDEVVRSPSLRWRDANNTANTIKEIIVIDDTPETEVDSTTVSMHNEGMIQGMGSSSSAGKSITTTSACDSRHESTFHSYQQYESAPCSGSPVDAGFWMPPPNGVIGSPVKWNWIAEGSNALHSSPLLMTNSSPAQVRSKLYTSSNF